MSCEKRGASDCIIRHTLYLKYTLTTCYITAIYVLHHMYTLTYTPYITTVSYIHFPYITTICVSTYKTIRLKCLFIHLSIYM